MSNKDYTEQILREEVMLDRGTLRFRNKEDRQKSKSKSIIYINKIEQALEKVIEGLKNDIEEVEQASSGRRPLWLTEIKDLCLDKIVFQGLNCFADAAGATEKSSINTVINKIGKRIEAEKLLLLIDNIEDRTYINKKGVTKKFSVKNDIKRKAFEHSGVYEKRISYAKHLTNLQGVISPNWSVSRRTHVATPIYNAILKYSKLFDKRTIHGFKKTKIYLEYKPEIQKEIENELNRVDWMKPLWDFMWVEPRDWTSMYEGGYLTPRLSGLCRMVKQSTFKQEEQIRNDFEKAKRQGTLPKYALALNALQKVPLKINKRLVEIVEYCWKNDIRVGSKFPVKKIYEEMPMLPLEDWRKLSKEAKARHVFASKKIISRNSEARSNRDIMARDLATAKENFNRIFWIVWNLDHRMRFYPMTSLNYHRDDHIKSWFLLGNGAKLDLTNDHWLRIHLANTGDFEKISKKSLDERIQWVADNEYFIMEIARDPEGTVDDWSKADKPFQFLAACIEYSNYITATENGEDYICHLAPALDGQNSGCQHYSAASRDRATGDLVGLVPSDRPKDVYQKLADLVNAELIKISKERKKQEGETQEDFEERLKYVDKWLAFGVTRKHLKTNCMTYVYSSKLYGFQKQIKKDIMDEEDREIHESGDPNRTHSWGSEKEQKAACLVLARISFDCVQQVLTSAKEGMEFFIELASALAKENKPVSWRTPIGFPVVQKYTKNNVVKIKCFLYDMEIKKLKRSQITLKNETDRNGDKSTANPIDPFSSRNGISPNVIHSYDASHMALTILKLKEQKVDDFMMIHDSFSVLPEHSWLLYDTVRDMFVYQYQDHCMYMNLYKSVIAKLKNPDVLKNLKFPTKGDLDLTLIKQSDYCFS